MLKLVGENRMKNEILQSLKISCNKALTNYNGSGLGNNSLYNWRYMADTILSKPS